jgi:cytochrome b561
MSQATARYTMPQIGLHSLMAVLIVGLYLFGLSLESFDKAVRGTYVNFHALGGVLVFVLLLARLLLRAKNPPPALPETMGPTFVKFAHLGHYALYALMAVVPLLGLATRFSGGRGIDFFAFQIASPVAENKDLHHLLHGAHGICANLLALLVLGHIVVALYHQFVLKDNILDRMNPRAK